MNNNDYFDEDDDVESDFPSADNFFLKMQLMLLIMALNNFV